MPGITGIISKRPRELNEKELEKMLKCMMYEPYYTSGVYTNCELNIYAGCVNLKGSFSDCMPVKNEKKDKILIYYGENFADKDVLNALKGKNHQFNSNNASYLIHLYEENGIDFLQELNGLFCGILIDIPTGNIVLFNDRYGIQRLFYHEDKNAFYFSSEAKAILKVCPGTRQIEINSLFKLIYRSSVLNNSSLFKDIHILPGGSRWIFNSGEPVSQLNYFNPNNWKNQPWLEKEFFYRKFNETFLKIIPRYFRSEQQIGMLLSSGLNSPLLMAARRIAPGKLPCFTFNETNCESFAVKMANEIAEVCRQPHFNLHLNNDFLTDFINYAEKTVFISDGYLDICSAPKLYLSRKLREISQLCMTDYIGDVVLQRNKASLVIAPDKKLFNPDISEYILDADNYISKINKVYGLSIFDYAPWFGFRHFVLEQSQFTVRTPFMDNELICLLHQAPPDVIQNNYISLRMIDECNPELSRVLRGKGAKRIRNYLLLKRADLNYERLFSVECSRNSSLVKLLILIDQSNNFFRNWFGSELSNIVREIILDTQTLTRPYFNKRFIELMVDAHIKGTGIYTKEISTIITIELIHRFLIL